MWRSKWLLAALFLALPLSARAQTRVQAAATDSGTKVSCSVTLSGVGAGHGLLVSIHANSSISSLGDGGDTFVQDVSLLPTKGIYLYRVASSMGGNLTITLTQSSSNYCVLNAAEYSTSLALDSSSAFTNVETNPFNFSVTTHSTANEVIAVYGASTWQCTGIASGSPYSLISSGGGDCLADKSVTSLGTYSSSFTDANPSAATYYIVGAAYYAPSAPACTPTLSLMGVGRCG